MQLPIPPSSAERPPIEVSTGHEMRQRFGSMSHLREIADTQVAEFGDGMTIDGVKRLQDAIEEADTSVGEGNLATGQAVLEQAPRPRELNEEVRDTLVELHQAERGEPTSSQRFQAMNGLLLEVTKEINILTDPKNGRLHHTDPQVQARKGVEAAFTQRYHNYFEDAQPENNILQNGERRTSHEVADAAYDLLLAYTEDKLRDPNLSAEKAEELRIARDILHLERKSWKEQYDAQNEAVDAVMEMVGRDNEQFNEARVRAAVRGCVGDELLRLQELVTVASETSDSFERFNLLNGIQQGRSPIQSAEAFDAWKQKRAENAKAAAERGRANMADSARKAIESIQGRVVEQPTSIEQPAQQATKSNEVAQPDPTNTDILSQVPEQAHNQYEQFVRSVLARVPRDVLLESIMAVARDRMMDGQHVDVNNLRQSLEQRLSGGLEIDPTKLEALARRIRQNGFYESNGGIWRVRGNSNLRLDQLAAEARRLVREIVSETV